MLRLFPKKIIYFSFLSLFFLPLPSLAVDDIDSSANIVGASFNIKVEESTGSFKYSYPLTLPNGRNGLNPILSLNYNSSDRANDNVTGLGWSLSTPYIERKNLHGSDNLYARHDFVSSLSGDLEDMSLSTDSYGTYGAKVDDGSFLSYEYNTDGSWTVIDSKGVTYVFGSSTASQVVNPSDSTQVFRWLLDEIIDLNGNTVTYSYTEDGNQLYPSQINYTSHDSDSGIYDILFTYETRSDIFSSFTSGFEVQTAQRLQQIDVEVSASVVRTYEFDYDTGDNDIRSLLSSITETGYAEDSSSVTKTPTTFDYSEAARSWTEDTSYSDMPLDIAGDGTGSMGVYIFDVNGDGFPDIVKARNGETRMVYINNGDNTWTEDASISIPFDFALSNGRDRGVRVFDLNGDGFQDLVKSNYYSSGSGDYVISYVYINNSDGTGWTEDTSVSVPIGFISDAGIDIGIRVFDVNGDGFQDIVRSRYLASTEVYVNNGDGTGWTLDSDYTVPVTFTNDPGFDNGVRFFDVNGDNLTDLVQAVNNSGVVDSTVFINNGDGTGWTEDTDFSVPMGFILSSRKDRGTRYLDFNGDGLIDLVRAQNDGTIASEVYINNGDGTGWTLDSSAILDVYFTNAAGNDVGTREIDVNNDGLDDVVYSHDMGTYSLHELHLADGGISDQLTEIENDRGGITTVSYEAATDQGGQMFFPLSTVSSVTTDDGLGNTSTATYEYYEGDYYYASEEERNFAGFGYVETTNGLGEMTRSYYHQGNDTETALGEATDDYAKLWHVYREENYDNEDNLYRVKLSDWQSTDLGDDRDFVYLEDELELMYDDDAGHVDRATNYTYDSSTGVMLTKTEFGEVTGDDDGTYTDTGDDDRTTTYTYATDASGVITALPSTVTLTDTDAATVSETLYTYDDLAFGLVETGNVTQTEAWISGSDYAATSYTYDTYGNVLTQTDPLGNVTTKVYDSENLYPATVTNDLSQTQTFEYNLAIGKPTKVTEVNDVETEVDYDGLGRQIEERKSSTSSATTLEATQTWSYDDSSLPHSITHRSYLSALVYAEEITYLDGLDRAIEVKTLDEEATGYNEAETTYDELGRTETSTLPEASASSAYDADSVSSELSETYTYDALGRGTAVTNVLGTTTTSYDGFTKTVTDALGNQKDYETDGLGRLVAVVEYLDSVANTTNYTWDAADRLTSMTDATGNVRNFTFDGRGLRLTAEDLHSPTDTSYGTWFYTYDEAGNLLTSLSPNGITVTYSYDNLNRQITEDASDATGLEALYLYDSCTNGTGRLCSTTVGGGAVTLYEYDAAGNKVFEAMTVDSVIYATSFTYDRKGNILTTTHPDNSIVTNTYNSLGLIETVQKQSTTDTTAVDVIVDTDYGPHGKVVSQTNGDGTVATYTYDEDARYRLTQKVTTGYVLGTGTSTTTTTTSFYAGAGDGSMYKNSTTWDIGHDATSATGTNPTGLTALARTGAITTGYSLNRAFLPFDTSSLPDDAVVTGATLNLMVSAVADDDNDGDDWVTVVQGGQASPTTLITSDYDNAGSVNSPIEGIDTSNRKDLTSITVGAYLSIPLNSTGQSWVSLTDYTKLALREGHDILDSAFSGAAGTANALTFKTSETAAIPGDPYLEVTYTVTETTPSTPVAATIQDLSYTYDDVGNILQIVDASDTDTEKTTTYTYDDLYRLESATVSDAADGDNETITYTYDAIGNITSRSDLGNYSYAGTDFANPHAVTSIVKTGVTKTYTYDNNGNLLSDGTNTYDWDYKNRLISSSVTETTSTTTTTTTSFYSGAGDGSMYENATTWDIGHDATSATGANPTGLTALARTGAIATGYSLNRAFLSFDTSSLPNDAVVTAATLSLMVSAVADNDNDGDDWVTVVQGGQASPTTLTVTDYDNAGSVNSPTEGIDTSNRKDLTSVAVGAYLSIPLNSTGQSWVSLTDYTKLALREGHDVLDSAFSGAAGTANALTFKTSETAGTAGDPYLSVTYTVTTSGTTETSTTAYEYNHSTQRISKSTEGVTTYYPTSDYSLTSGTSTVYVSGPGGLTASIEGSSTGSTTRTIHTDHLGSTSVVTDRDGTMIEFLDYHPYGTERSTWGSGTSGEAESQKTYIGEYSDDESGLSYLNARYYDPERGQFLSEDAVFLAVGINQKELNKILVSPQRLNSYSYTENNPIINIDLTGNSTILAWLFQPASTFQQVGTWLNASLGLNAVGRPLTSSLLQHSLKLGPGDVEINQQNQGSWGNAINQIQESTDFNSAINGYLSTDGKNGSVSKTYDAAHGSVVFGSGDLQSGIHGTFSTSVRGMQNNDGTWNLNVGITDRYDYTNQGYQGDEGGKILTGFNNAANFSQNQGVISNYNVNFTLSIPNYNPNNKK